MTTSSKPAVVIADYDPEWPSKYSAEEAVIRALLGNLCVRLFHVGSTAVPGLAAKPIIDIIAVVKDTMAARALLEPGGYQYKGEYNIPLRDFCDKNHLYHLHVYDEENDNILQQLIFRDFLRSNPSAVKEYDEVKRAAAAMPDARTKVATGLLKYNVSKNNFIMSVLDAAGFNGLCTRLCAQPNEWQAYNEIRGRAMNTSGQRATRVMPEEQHNPSSHLVLCEGTDVVAAAQVNQGEIKFLGTRGGANSDAHRAHLLATIEKWISKKRLTAAEWP